MNEVYGTNFQNDAEVERWAQKMKKLNNWQDTEEAKKLEETRTHYTIDQELIQIAEQKGASPELLELVKAKVAESKAKIGDLETEVKRIQGGFEKDRKLFDSLNHTQERYKVFTKIAEASIKRRKAGIQLPVIMEVFEAQPGINIYMPYDDNKCALEKHLYGLLHDNTIEVSSNGESPRRIVRDSSSVLIATLNQESQGKPVTERASQLAEAIREYSLFKALGIITKVTIIADTQTKPIYSLGDGSSEIKRDERHQRTEKKH